MVCIEYAQLCRVLECFSSSNNNLRQEAEDAFASYQQTNVEELLLCLIRILKEHANADVRFQAISSFRTVLRPFLWDNQNSSWNGLSPQSRSYICTELLNVLERDTAPSVQNSVCTAVSSLGGRLASLGEWTELNARLISMIESDNARFQELGLKVFTGLVPHISSMISKNITGLHRVMSNCAKSQSYVVRYQCLCFVSEVVLSEKRSTWKRFQSLLPDFYEGLAMSIQAGNEDSAAEYLYIFCEIASADAAFYKPHLTPFVQMLTVCAREQNDALRQIAVEVLLSIAEDKPLMCLKVPNFVNEVIRILLELMLTVEKDGQWIDEDDQEDDDSESEEPRNYDVGESGLDRLAAALGGEHVMNVIFHYVSEYLRKEEWQFKLVGVMAISQTAEYLPEEGLDAHLEEIVNMLFVQLKDPHHRVRFAACQAFGQIALDHLPTFQKHYANVVLPALIATMDDSFIRVQTHAISALINFAEEVEKPDLIPFADTLMQKLFERLAVDKPYKLREQALTGIAVVAGVLEKDFLKYYSIVLPAAKQILQTCVSKEERMLRGKAAECVAIIGLSVGAEVFEKDAHDIMNVLISIYSEGMDADNTVRDYIQEAFSRLCRTLKDKFYPYLLHLMPSIIKTLSVTPDIFDEEKRAQVKEQDMTMVSIAKEKYAGLKTSVIQEIIQALDLLTVFVQTVGEKFKEFLFPTAQVLLPLLNFFLSDDVKRSTLLAMSEIIMLSQRFGVDSAVLSAWVNEIMEKVFRNLCMDEEQQPDAGDLDLMITEAGGLARCLEHAGPNILNDAQVTGVCTKVFLLIKESSQRSAELAARKQDPDFDEEDVNRLEEEGSSEQTVRSTLLEIIAAVMKHHPQQYLHFGAPLCQEFIATFLHPNCTPEDNALALYVCDDVLEHLGDSGISLWPTFAEQLVNCVLHSDPGVRQAAAYGIILAARCSQFPVELIQRAAANLVTVLSEPGSKSNPDVLARDNVIAALGAIVLRRGVQLPQRPEDYLQLWIDNLPLKADDEEGQRTHKDLIDLLLKANTQVLGVNNSNVPKLTAICASIYKTRFSSLEIDAGIRTFLQSVGFDMVQRLGAGFSKKLQQGLERIHRDVFLEKNPATPS